MIAGPNQTDEIVSLLLRRNGEQPTPCPGGSGRGARPAVGSTTCGSLIPMAMHRRLCLLTIAMGQQFSPHWMTLRSFTFLEPATPRRFRFAHALRKWTVRIEFNLIPASQLGPGEQIDWIWHGYLAKGFVTLLIGLWKAGKSSLISRLLEEFESGGDLAGSVTAAKTLVITEEGPGLWARRRDDVGFGDRVHFNTRPFKGCPKQKDWLLYIDSVAAAAVVIHEEITYLP